MKDEPRVGTPGGAAILVAAIQGEGGLLVLPHHQRQDGLPCG
jgi:hypothetical protein